MSCSYAKGAWEVRWRDETTAVSARVACDDEGAGERRSTKPSTIRKVGERSASGCDYGQGGGVYPYRLRTGRGGGARSSVRTARGRTSGASRVRRRPRTTADGQTERVERRGGASTRRRPSESFGRAWLERRKPYLEEGTWCGVRARRSPSGLMPVLESVPLERMQLETRGSQELMDQMVESMEAGELAPKTINNTLGTLVVALNAAVKEKRIVANPALEVPKLPAAHIERDYLRLHEIPLYLNSCSELYRPLAETLIGSGLRISEAIGLQIGDLELEEAGGMIVVYRSRKKRNKIGSTKSDRFDPVEIGPGIVENNAGAGSHDGGGWRRRSESNAPLFVMPVRTRTSTTMDVGRAVAPARRSTATPSPVRGTRRRCRTRACATCPYTPCATPLRRRGSPAATH